MDIMKKILKNITACCSLVLLAACHPQTPPQTEPLPQVNPIPSHALGIIGQVEPVYFLPMKSPFPSRIDTGAETSSLDAYNIRTFERDGEKWVSFAMKNRETGEVHKFEKELVRKTTIKRSHKDEKRKVVLMNIKIGGQTLNAEFTLANRSDFEYQGLIGRNILTGRAIVDTALTNTLH